VNTTTLRTDDLPGGPVIALSARPGDALRGCGGALARHVRGGAQVRLGGLAGGEGGDEAAREAEVRAAARALGIDDVIWWTAAPAALAEDHLLVERLRAEAPEGCTVYAPDPAGGHVATRIAAAAGLALGGTLSWYALGDTPPAGVLLDVSDTRPEKDLALERLGDVDRAGLDSALASAAGTPGIERVEAVRRVTSAEARAALAAAAGLVPGRATAVLSTWNKCADVLANLEALAAQTYPFERVVVVDNASTDDTMRAVRARFPEVELIVMPHSSYGACETFNIGFASAGTELIAILDDDVVLPPTWLERATTRLDGEPESTAIVSTKIVEPGMPEAYRDSEAINTERYMSTFRGCASLARQAAIAECGYYDERLYIYGNERDLTCRLLNRGYRVLQFPGTHAFHKTPFGIQMGKRSLYFHARNAWLVQLKYAPLGALLRMPFLVVSKVLLRSRSAEESGDVSDATGTIGIGASLKATKGAWWVLVRAGWSVLCHLPYCWKHREPCRAPDYELPIE